MTEGKSSKKRKPSSPRTHASEFAPGIFVGGWKDAEGFVGQRFCVLDEMPADAPADQGLPIYDGAHEAPILANLDRVVELMRMAREAGEPVLVFCGHGVRRSPLAAAWYLHRMERLPLDEAYARVKAVRPQVEHAREWITRWEILEKEKGRPARSTALR
ncbi:MAG: dual specificity protein phosphatase [Thermoplasmata archaeon]